jgi:hypothetical protein
VITKWFWERNINILGRQTFENLWSILKRRVDKQNPTNSDKLQALIMQE